MNKNDIFKNIWNILFAFWFIAEFTITHTNLARIALALFSAFSLFMIVLKMRLNIALRLNLFYLLFIGVCYINIKLGYSINSPLSNSLLFTLLKNFVFFVLVYFYASSQSIESFKKVFIFSTSTASILLLVITYINTGSFILRGEDSLVNANSLATCTAFAACWIIATTKNIKYLKISDVVLFVVLSSFFILSGTRKAILSFTLGVILFICLKYPNKIMRNVVSISIFLVISYVILIKVPFLYDVMGKRIESLFSLIQGNVGDASAEARRRFIMLGWEYIKKRPFIGYGINTFKTIPGSYGTYSHNNYIELLFSVGIIGTLSYYLMYFFILIKALKGYFKTKSINIMISITFIILLMVMHIAAVAYYSRSSLLFIVICYILAERADDKNEINKTI